MKIFRHWSAKMRQYSHIFVIFALIMGIFGVNTAKAASLTTMSDTLTRIKAATIANHTIQFITPTGVGTGETVTVTFPAGPQFTGLASVLFSDVDFAEGNSSCASFSEKTLAGSASGATWGVSTSATVLTITSGTGTITAGNCLRIKIGTNATNQTTGVNQLTNPAAGTYSIALTAGPSDSGTLSVVVISDDTVAISATVSPTLTFSLSSTTAGFGTLASGTGRWATGGGGANASAGTDPTAANSAHTLTMATNGTTGYTVTYNGATLTSGLNTIPAVTITGDSDGSPGTSQFALCGKGTSGSPTVASGYVCSTTSDYNFVASTTTPFASRTAPASSDVVSVAYLANISGSQQAGNYTTSVVFICTANF